FFEVNEPKSVTEPRVLGYPISSACVTNLLLVFFLLAVSRVAPESVFGGRAINCPSNAWLETISREHRQLSVRPISRIWSNSTKLKTPRHNRNTRMAYARAVTQFLDWTIVDLRWRTSRPSASPVADISP